MRHPGVTASARGAVRLARRLAQDRSGLAMIELALIGPLLLTLIFAGLELAWYAQAHLRAGQIAVSVADNGARVMTGIDEANIYEIFSGADVIGGPIGFSRNGRIVLSSLQDNGKTGALAGQMINWQRCFGSLAAAPAYGLEGRGRNDATLAQGMGKAGRRITSLPNTAVMFVEVTYDYQPLVGRGWYDMPDIRIESAMNVRGRQNQDITNVQGLTVRRCT